MENNLLDVIRRYINRRKSVSLKVLYTIAKIKCNYDNIDQFKADLQQLIDNNQIALTDLREDVTQVSNVDGGKLDTFGSKPVNLNDDDILNQLFMLRDYEQ